jgi:hypothetical protein
MKPKMSAPSTFSAENLHIHIPAGSAVEIAKIGDKTHVTVKPMPSVVENSNWEEVNKVVNGHLRKMDAEAVITSAQALINFYNGSPPDPHNLGDLIGDLRIALSIYKKRHGS